LRTVRAISRASLLRAGAALLPAVLPVALLASLLASIAVAQTPSTPPGSTTPPDSTSSPAAPAASAPRARVEARSSDLLAVGTVQGNRLILRLSRVEDNAPVGDAVVAVMLRGSTHPAVAEADGSYAVETPDLSLPGPATVEFVVTWGEKREELTGTLAALGNPGTADEKGSARQLGWWVLNFAVCAGFLWLWSRRRRSSDAEG